MRTISAVLSVLALGLIGWGVYLALAPEPEEGRVVVDQADRDLGEIPIGEYPLTFRIANPTRRPCRLMGLIQGCGLNSCFAPKHPEQTVVQPGESILYDCDLYVREPGAFETSIVLHQADRTTRKVEITVRGVATPAGRSHDAPAHP